MSGHILEYLITFNNVVTVACTVLLLPLAYFRKTRVKTHLARNLLIRAAFRVIRLLKGVEMCESHQRVTFYESGP